MLISASEHYQLAARSALSLVRLHMPVIAFVPGTLECFAGVSKTCCEVL